MQLVPQDLEVGCGGEEGGERAAVDEAVFQAEFSQVARDRGIEEWWCMRGEYLGPGEIRRIGNQGGDGLDRWKVEKEGDLGGDEAKIAEGGNDAGEVWVWGIIHDFEVFEGDRG